MLAAQRQTVILEVLHAQGAATVADLTERLDVSEMTVRRDLQKLEARGTVARVHGGAVLPGHRAAHPSAVDEPAFTEKAALHHSAKLAIARRAAELVRPGTVVGVSPGTTTWELAPYLARTTPLTVVTNSVTVSERIAELAPGAQTVILTGGTRTPSAGLVGPIANLAVQAVNIDQLFIGCFGADPAAGLTSPSFAEAETNRALVHQSRQVVVVADASKWRTLGLAGWATLDQVDVFVTDDTLPADARDQLADTVGRLIVVSAAETAPGSAA